MNKEEKNQEDHDKDQGYKATTVYFPPDMIEEMDQYKEIKRYGTRSEMLRRAFQVLKKVFPLDSDTRQEEEGGLFRRLDTVEQKLDKMEMEQQLDKKKERMIKKRREIITGGTTKVDTKELKKIKEIRNAIIELLREYGPLKDFVLMDKLGEKYDRGDVWEVLMELQKEGIVDNHKNEWFLKDGQA